MFQGYHQEWIGRDGSLNDKLLLKFSNLNTCLMLSLSFGNISLAQILKSSKILLGLGLIDSSQRASLEHLEGKAESRSRPWSVWKCGKAGRGGLTGHWTSSSCRPGRSRSFHFPIVGLHPCRLADPTISGYPAQITLHDKSMSHLGVDVVSYMCTWRPVKLPVVAALKILC